MWSRQDSVGVSFLNLHGDVVATVRNATFSFPVSGRGTVILKKQRRLYLLHPETHQLRAISRSRAASLQRTERVTLPQPLGGSGGWEWSTPSPSGVEVLAQWTEQVSECRMPVAMIEPTRGSPPMPITGGSLPSVGPSFALGWTGDDRAVVYVGNGPCTGSTNLKPGVYVFDAEGGAIPIRMSPASYGFSMWSNTT
jgi:hypothetical protein